jgi:hypothetical protein
MRDQLLGTRIAAAAVIAVPAAIATLHRPALADQIYLNASMITAYAEPFSTAFPITNLFDSARGDYASKTQGAGTPLSNTPTNGTWVNFDFGSPQTIDTFINRSRVNTVDVIGSSRLIFSQDPTFQESDNIVTFGSDLGNGAGLIRHFTPVTARYVRWEVTQAGSTGRNLGSRQMYFINSPRIQGMRPLPNPAVIGGTPAFNATFPLAAAANGNAGTSGTGNEYASLGGQEATFVDFDFGKPTAIGAYDYYNRELDVVGRYLMIFSNSPDFSSPVAEVERFANIDNPADGTADGNLLTTERLETPVTARYVRFQVQSIAKGVNPGISDMEFYAARLDGDANLDGKIDPDDFALIDRGSRKSLAGWFNGDFNLDNAINQADYLLIDASFAAQNGGTLSPAYLTAREARFGPEYAAALAAAVPEPATLAACGLAVSLLVPRPRRRA